MTTPSIRPGLPADIPAIAAIYAHAVLHGTASWELEPPDEAEMQRRYEAILAGGYPYLVAEREGDILGYAYAGPLHSRPAYDWAVETSIYLDQNARGGGLGRKLHDALEAVLREQGFLNMNACIAYPEVEDEYLTKNSAEFHAHLGYRMVGGFTKCGYKFHRWYGMVWMEKLIGEHLENQPPVIPFPQIGNVIHEKYGID